MRHLRHPGEGGTTFEVHQHEVQVLAGVGHRQGQHQGAQHLGLPGPGGTDHQPVRAHPLLGGLLDVQDHRLPVRSQPDRYPEPVPGQPGSPGHLGVEVAHIRQAEQVGQLCGDRLCRPTLAPITLVQEWGQPPSCGLRLGHAHRVRGGRVRGVTEAQDAHRRAALAIPLQQQPYRVPVGELVPPLRQVQHGHAVDPVMAHRRVPGRDLPAVDHEQDMRTGRVALGAEPRPVGQPRGHQALDVRPGLADHPGRADGVPLPGGVRVREPLHPFPCGQRLRCCDHRDLQLVGWGERGQMADHRPGEGAGTQLRSGDLDTGRGAQIQSVRQVRLPFVRTDEPVRSRGTHRVHLRQRGDRRFLQVQRERLCGGADPGE